MSRKPGVYLRVGVLLAACTGGYAELRVGFGRREITPEVGMQIPGFFEKKAGTAVADPLFAVAAAFESGDERAIVIGADVLCILEATVKEVREQVEKQTGVPGSHIMIGASHTHTGGPNRPLVDGSVDEKYMRMATEGITRAARAAWEDRRPAEIAVGHGEAKGLAFNRRFVMRDGGEITHPGKPGTRFHPQIVRRAGPVDDSVGVLAVRSPGGALRGMLVNFACHNTVMSNETFSADYVGTLRKHLEARYGREFATVFLLGACGDITQVDNFSREKQGGPEYCDWFGKRLAEAAVQSLQKAKWIGDASVAARQERVNIPIRTEVEVARERPPPYGLGSGPEAFFTRERTLLAEDRSKDPNVSCEVQGIRIGPLALVSNGAELFCDYGLRIKQCSRVPQTWVVTLANQWIGYVPTGTAYAAGGYEPRTRRSSKLVVEGGQRLVETSLKVLADLAPSTQPGA
jgi:hypothetical protein